MKKKTQVQDYIDRAVEQAKKELAGNNISDCNIEMNVNVGDAIELVAEGLIENAKALGDLAQSIKSQHLSAIYIADGNVRISGKG